MDRARPLGSSVANRVGLITSHFLAAAVAAVLTLAPAARADTFTWTGAATANWNNAGNWTGGGGSGVPGGGAAQPDSITFNAGSTNNLTTNNDISGLTLGTIAVTAPAAPVSIGGNPFTLNAGFDLSAATQDLTVTLGTTNGTGLTLGAGQTWNVATGRTLTVSAFISGTTASITKTGGGTLSLPVSSNNTGGYGTNITAMTILDGIVAMPNGNSLGNANTTTPNNVILNGGTLQFTTSNTLNANRQIGLGPNAPGTIDTPTGVAFIVNGVLADAVPGSVGSLIKTGAGTLTLGNNSPTTASTFTGSITVQAGVLTTARTAGFGDPVAGTTVMSGAEVQLNSGITVAEPLTLNGAGVSADGALRKASGANDTTWSGPITLSSAARINADVSTNALILTGGITATGAGQNLTIGGSGNTTVSTAGIATGTGSLTKDGTGTLTLNAANTYTGPTTVSAGTLSLGAYASLASPVITVGTGSAATLNVSAVTGGFTVVSGQTLRGSGGTVAGAVGVAGGGTLAPGTSPGILTMTGAVTMNPGATFSVQINGPTTAGTDFSQLNLTGGGTIDLNGATLTGTFGYAPQSTDSITIITGGTVLNQFAGGTTFNFGGYTGMISYPGNAVVLSGFAAVPEPGGVLAACGAIAALVGWRRRRRPC